MLKILLYSFVQGHWQILYQFEEWSKGTNLYGVKEWNSKWKKKCFFPEERGKSVETLSEYGSLSTF